MEEANEILETLDAWGASDRVDPAVLQKALFIPQDRPEAMCLEELKDVGEGLMANPLPKEMWRKSAVKGGKKGGGKKKKK